MTVKATKAFFCGTTRATGKTLSKKGGARYDIIYAESFIEEVQTLLGAAERDRRVDHGILRAGTSGTLKGMAVYDPKGRNSTRSGICSPGFGKPLKTKCRPSLRG